MKMYCAQPTVTVKTGNGDLTRQIPTFYLHPNVQGIVSMEHAEQIVRDMLGQGDHPNIEVHPNVCLVDVD